MLPQLPESKVKRMPIVTELTSSLVCMRGPVSCPKVEARVCKTIWLRRGVRMGLQNLHSAKCGWSTRNPRCLAPALVLVRCPHSLIRPRALFQIEGRSGGPSPRSERPHGAEGPASPAWSKVLTRTGGVGAVLKQTLCLPLLGCFVLGPQISGTRGSRLFKLVKSG